MDIESSNPAFDWKTIFQPINTQNAHQLNSKSALITNSFSTTMENSSPSLSLTLTKEALILSEGSNG